MREKILVVFMALGLSFGMLHATEACSEIEVMAVQETLQSYSASESETVEVVIHNPDYCLSTITDISLSDSENFELDLDFGAVPCGSDEFSMRGYQFCTVGVTFKPTTSDGDFETDVQVSTTSTPVACATVEGEVVVCDECNSDDDDNDDNDGSCGHGGHGHHGGNCGHGKHGKCDKGHDGHGKHGKCDKGHDGHGTCGSDRDDDRSACSHRHNRWCGHNGGYGTCSHRHNRWCGYNEDDNDDNDNGHTCPPLDPVKKLMDSDARNYINCLNLINPVGTSVVEVYDDIVYFNDYNEKEVGLATFALDDVVDFPSMLTFTATIEEGLFMPRMSGDDGQYMTTDVRVTKKYGFMFPNDFDLTELNFTTWGRSFTGSIEDLSVTEVTNENLLD